MRSDYLSLYTFIIIMYFMFNIVTSMYHRIKIVCFHSYVCICWNLIRSKLCSLCANVFIIIFISYHPLPSPSLDSLLFLPSHQLSRSSPVPPRGALPVASSKHLFAMKNITIECPSPLTPRPSLLASRYVLLFFYICQ